MKRFLEVHLVVLMALIAGCATPETRQNAGDTATCEVCRYNNDLACLSVKVKDTTPHVEYEGKSYYFCSQECRSAFEKRPAKYVQHGRRKGV